MPAQIIADSCCDLTPSLRNVLRVKVASLSIRVNGNTYIDDIDIDTKALLADMRASNDPPSTACPSPEDYADLMGAQDECFVITLSSKLSGSHNAAMVGRDLALERNPNLKIFIVDSESATAGETLLALTLRDMIDAELSFDEICTQITAFAAKMSTRFVLEDLSNLVKNGRITKVAGFVGTMLNLRPIMSDDGHGNIIALEKIRGTQKALARLVELTAEALKNTENASVTMVMTYCNCPERAMTLKNALMAACPAVRSIIVLPTNGISSVYAADGGVVIAYLPT